VPLMQAVSSERPTNFCCAGCSASQARPYWPLFVCSLMRIRNSWALSVGRGPFDTSRVTDVPRSVGVGWAA
jgi:hypothetical protein